MVDHWPWRMLCRCASSPVADALLPCSCCFGGCFATVVFFELGRCFAAVLRRMRCHHGCAFRWMLRHRFRLRACSPLSFLATFYPLCAGPALRVTFVWVAGLECPPPPCFFCCPSVVFMATDACLTFSSVFLSLQSFVLLC